MDNELTRLDQLDILLASLSPIERLFQLMGAVRITDDSSELLKGCAEIGLNLTGQFRKELERAFEQSPQANE